MTIIIPGTVRSGTTFITKALIDKGIHMLDWEMPCNEDGDIWAWNAIEKLNNIPSFEKVPFAYEPSIDFITRLQQYRAFHDKEYETYGFKEPKCKLLFGAYARVWPDAHYILCIRNPLNVIWSQRKRGFVTGEDARSMAYHAHITASVMHHIIKGGLKIHFFNYDGQIEQEQKALNDFLGMELDLVSNWKHAKGDRWAKPQERILV